MKLLRKGKLFLSATLAIIITVYIVIKKESTSFQHVSSSKVQQIFRQMRTNINTKKPKNSDRIKSHGNFKLSENLSVYSEQTHLENLTVSEIRTTTSKQTVKETKSPDSQIRSPGTRIWSPGTQIWNKMIPGFISDEEAMTYKPCEDYNILTSPNTTKLFITDQSQNYKLNDRIHLTIVAYNHYGQPKTEGGDLFIATMKSSSKNASAPGLVTDLLNGSYNVEFDALWTGKAIISTTLVFTKQHAAATIRLRIKHIPAEYMVAGYDKNNITDTGLCHWNRSMLIYDEICKGDNPIRPYVCTDVGLTPERTKICNFTTITSGNPWYCLKPLNKKLDCKSWAYISRHESYELPGLTKCEMFAYQRTHSKVLSDVEVNIEPQFDEDDRQMIDLPNNQCSKYNKTLLWLRRELTGFFYNNTWHFRHCKGVSEDKLTACMKNKTFYFIGDSTLRQWYLRLIDRYGCKLITETWTQLKWYKKTMCHNSELNFTLTFSMHDLPLFIPRQTDKSIVTKSIDSYIDDISNDENAVLVFHMFTHLIPHHPKLYKLKMTHIRNSAENLFRRNKLAKIMIKAPHIYPENSVVMAYQYDRISYEVFHGLFDRIYYLNNKDSSIAKMPREVHPDDVVVDAMLNQALLYSCD